MSEPKIIKIFISHAWEQNPDYNRIVGMLDGAPLFTWHNSSVPYQNPLDMGTQRRLEDQLYDQIKPAQIVVILSCMQFDYRYWIQKQIDIAQELNKPIIGVTPWEKENVLNMVQSAANEMVGWDTQSIVDAIRKRST